MSQLYGITHIDKIFIKRKKNQLRNYCRLLLLPGVFPQIESIKQCYMVTEAIPCQGLVYPPQTLAVGGGDERLGERSAGSNGAH